MTPGSLRQLARVADFSPILIPYWTFDSWTTASWRAEVGRTVRTKNSTRVVWRWESGTVKKCFDDLLISGTTRLSQRLLGQIQRYNLKDLIEYEPKFLAGQQAQAYDLPLDSAWGLARQTMREQTRDACMKRASTKKIRNFSMNLDFSDESWRYILLPVYVAAYHYQGIQYQVIINGQTGAISGQRPADWLKIWLAALAAFSPAILLGLIGLFFMLAGESASLFFIMAFILASAGIAASLILIKKAQELDDV
jgi:hypothetical protein